jgi:hypothetical protein
VGVVLEVDARLPRKGRGKGSLTKGVFLSRPLRPGYPMPPLRGWCGDDVWVCEGASRWMEVWWGYGGKAAAEPPHSKSSRRSGVAEAGGCVVTWW